MVTIKDVAKSANVSIATVSRLIRNDGFISEELKKRINEAIKELDYKPNLVARSLKLRKSNTIGLIFPDIENPFFISLIKKAEEVAYENGYSVILGNTENNPEKEKLYLEVFKGKLVDGYIIITSFSDKNYISESLKDEKVIYVDRSLGIDGETCIKLDNKKGIKLALEYLISLNHKKIGIINVPTNITTGKERYEGYKQILRKNNIEIDENIIKFAGFSAESSLEKTKELLELKNRPTAILPTSNLTTVGALMAINELNLKIPEDISIIGFDELDWSILLNPPLTTIKQPAYRFGEIGIKTLLKKIGGKKLKNKTIVLKPEIIIRKSCRKIN